MIDRNVGMNQGQGMQNQSKIADQNKQNKLPPQTVYYDDKLIPRDHRKPQPQTLTPQNPQLQPQPEPEPNQPNQQKPQQFHIQPQNYQKQPQKIDKSIRNPIGTSYKDDPVVYTKAEEKKMMNLGMQGKEQMKGMEGMEGMEGKQRNQGGKMVDQRRDRGWDVGGEKESWISAMNRKGQEHTQSNQLRQNANKNKQTQPSTTPLPQPQPQQTSPNSNPSNLLPSPNPIPQPSPQPQSLNPQSPPIPTQTQTQTLTQTQTETLPKKLHESQSHYTDGQLYGWNNKYNIKIPRISFDKSCKKCQGTGAMHKRFHAGTIPCTECYSKAGYCKKCYGTGINFTKNTTCLRWHGCKGQKMDRKSSPDSRSSSSNEHRDQPTSKKQQQ